MADKKNDKNSGKKKSGSGGGRISEGKARQESIRRPQFGTILSRQRGPISRNGPSFFVRKGINSV
jgi:hypothetical protein